MLGSYNRALWPAVVALWLVTAIMAARWIRRGYGSRSLMVLLAVHWAWSGIAYHWAYFRAINPAATVFAAMFVAQAVCFAWLAAFSPARFCLDRSPRALLGGSLVIYSLAYPFIGIILGLHLPRMPLFAVPCPTTLLTTGLLLTSPGMPRLAGVVPALWALIASSAAFTLGIWADSVLLACAGLLIGRHARAARAWRAGRRVLRAHMTSPLESHRIERIGWLRAAVLGANDGIISTSSLMIGVAAAASGRRDIVVAGVAGLGRAVSMAAGEYVSVSSQSDSERAELRRERQELAADPDAERRELADIYVTRGLSAELAPAWRPS